jgi:hypothetical protein
MSGTSYSLVPSTQRSGGSFGEEIFGVSDFMRQDARRVASLISGVHSCVSTDGAS